MKSQLHLISAVGLLMICASTIAYADDVAVSAAATTISSNTIVSEYTPSELTPSIYAKLDATQQKTVADNWHLTTDDYSRYLSLMTNTPNAVYYKDKNLDPSWILGFNAKDEQERQKYVIIAIQNERARIEKELAFQRDFTQLQQQIFPNQKPVNWSVDEANSALPKISVNKK